MSGAGAPDWSALDAAGLNLHAVFDLAALPAPMRAALDAAGEFRQAILIGHGGRRLWQQVQAAGIASADPVDDFTRAAVAAWFAAQRPGGRHAFRYPGSGAVGLQALGQLAGWHHESPFRVGVHSAWGSWFAYRALLVADSDWPATPPDRSPPPCAACAGRPCVAACPADALSGGGFALARCIAFRRLPGSPCAASCRARLACPVRPEHRYDDAQLAHSYGHSLAMIEAWKSVTGDDV